MPAVPLARRLRALPTRRVCGHLVPVAAGPWSRLLGLGGLRHEQAGAGLLILRCSSVHTLGMRFPLDLVFLDRGGRPLAVRRSVGPRRFAWCRGAAAVLELPVPQGGESVAPRT